MRQCLPAGNVGVHVCKTAEAGHTNLLTAGLASRIWLKQTLYSRILPSLVSLPSPNPCVGIKSAKISMYGSCHRLLSSTPNMRSTVGHWQSPWGQISLLLPGDSLKGESKCSGHKSLGWGEKQGPDTHLPTGSASGWLERHFVGAG